MFEPAISIYLVRPIVKYLEWLGKEHADILALLSLEEAELADNQTSISYSRLQNILETATTASGSCSVGLHVYDNFDLTEFGRVGYLVLTSATLYEGLRDLLTLKTYVDESTTYALDRDAGQVTISFYWSDIRFRGHKHDIIHTIMFFVACVRTYVSRQWMPHRVEVQFPKPPAAELAEYEAVLGSNIIFDAPVNSVGGHEAIFDTALNASDGFLNRMISSEIMDRSRTLTARLQFIQDLNGLIQKEISTDCRIGHVAKKMGMSQRSLQRRLHQYGVKFSEVVEYSRLQIALRNLRNKDCNLIKISELLGYSESSAFIRAFRRWTGMTPLQYRKVMQ